LVRPSEPVPPTIIINENADSSGEAEGPFEQDDVGKIKGGIDSYPKPIPDNHLADAERQLKESLAQREHEQSRFPRGSPTGDAEDREHDREWRRHQKEIDAERRVLHDISGRLDDVEHKTK
jgi:hypothetical protein